MTALQQQNKEIAIFESNNPKSIDKMIREGQNVHKFLRYDKSWDQLMPAVQKVHEKVIDAAKISEERFQLVYQAKNRFFRGISIFSELDKVFEATHKFSKWYNTQFNKKHKPKPNG